MDSPRPVPWTINDNGEVVDADGEGFLVFNAADPLEQALYESIVAAVNARYGR